jgi:CRISPR/Cas system-associated endoribonuclease Cas2
VIRSAYKDKGDSAFKVAISDLEAGPEHQVSAFRLHLTRRHQLNDAEDSLRIYPLCGACMCRIEIIGLGVVTQDPEIIVI